MGLRLPRAPARLAAAVAVVIIVIVALIAYWRAASPHRVEYITVDAPYAFIVQNSTGGWEIIYYTKNGSLQVIPIRNISVSNDFWQALNTVYQFNQQVVPQHSGYQNLTPIITVGAQNGIVKLPEHNDIVNLNSINSGDYTIVAVPQQYVNLFMKSLDTGYNFTGVPNLGGIMYIQSNYPQIYNLLGETMDLQSYSSPSIDYAGDFLLITTNNTLIPWAVLGSISFGRYGQDLSFISNAGIYNGG